MRRAAPAPAAQLRRDAGRVENLAIALWAGVHGVCMLAVSGKLQAGGPTSVQRLLDVLVGRSVECAPQRNRVARKRA
jgi:hypothetical protein